MKNGHVEEDVAAGHVHGEKARENQAIRSEEDTRHVGGIGAPREPSAGESSDNAGFRASGSGGGGWRRKGWARRAWIRDLSAEAMRAEMEVEKGWN